MKIRRVATLRTLEAFENYLQELGINIPADRSMDSGQDAPLAQPVTYGNRWIGNRFAVLPMEGWDGTEDGKPTPLVRRRWRNFGASGAKLIWGCEAVAVRVDGRANPNQLILDESTIAAMADLRAEMVGVHAERFERVDDLYVGLQLTHSGRFARPLDKKRMAPQILYHHPFLDSKFGLNQDFPLLTDESIDELIGDFVAAARLAHEAGFDFVDVKHCHGYLGHEFLTAIDREGRYGGSFENRTRFLREVVAGIRAQAPGLDIGVRLSAFDFVPFSPQAEDQRGVPGEVDGRPYPYAFGGDGSGIGIDLDEPIRFLDLLRDLGIRLVCITAGSPYYTPHIQRPALFPPSDGYLPPEDPLAGVARQLVVTAELKRQRPELLYVGSGYSYLQEWLPNVAQAVCRQGWTDFVGLGRMMLSYPELPSDILSGRPLQRTRYCRTFSDCTTAPRGGMVSGCYPLDDFYRNRPEYERLVELKQNLKQNKAQG